MSDVLPFMGKNEPEVDEMDVTGPVSAEIGQLPKPFGMKTIWYGNGLCGLFATLFFRGTFNPILIDAVLRGYFRQFSLSIVRSA